MWYSEYNILRLKDTRKVLRKKQTKTEDIFWNKVRAKQFLWLKFRRQHSIWRYILDFYCNELKIWIEIDWDNHFEENTNEYDKIRTEYLETAWVKVIRYTNKEIMENIKWVLFDLKNKLWK